MSRATRQKASLQAEPVALAEAFIESEIKWKDLRVDPISFLKGLERNIRVKVLNLSGSTLTEEATLALLKFLKISYCIRALDVTKFTPGMRKDEFNKKLFAILQRNQKILQLTVSAEDSDCFKQLSETNPTLCVYVCNSGFFFRSSLSLLFPASDINHKLRCWVEKYILPLCVKSSKCAGLLLDAYEQLISEKQPSSEVEMGDFNALPKSSPSFDPKKVALLNQMLCDLAQEVAPQPEAQEITNLIKRWLLLSVTELNVLRSDFDIPDSWKLSINCISMTSRSDVSLLHLVEQVRGPEIAFHVRLTPTNNILQQLAAHKHKVFAITFLPDSVFAEEHLDALLECKKLQALDLSECPAILPRSLLRLCHLKLGKLTLPTAGGGENASERSEVVKWFAETLATELRGSDEVPNEEEAIMRLAGVSLLEMLSAMKNLSQVEKLRLIGAFIRASRLVKIFEKAESVPDSPRSGAGDEKHESGFNSTLSFEDEKHPPTALQVPHLDPIDVNVCSTTISSSSANDSHVTLISPMAADDSKENLVSNFDTSPSKLFPDAIDRAVSLLANENWLDTQIERVLEELPLHPLLNRISIKLTSSKSFQAIRRHADSITSLSLTNQVSGEAVDLGSILKNLATEFTLSSLQITSFDLNPALDALRDLVLQNQLQSLAVNTANLLEPPAFCAYSTSLQDLDLTGNTELGLSVEKAHGVGILELLAKALLNVVLHGKSNDTSEYTQRLRLEPVYINMLKSADRTPQPVGQQLNLISELIRVDPKNGIEPVRIIESSSWTAELNPQLSVLPPGFLTKIRIRLGKDDKLEPLLRHGGALTSIDLLSSSIQLLGTRSLEMITSSCEKLESLTLSGCDFSTSHVPENAPTFASLINCKNLRSLFLSNCGIVSPPNFLCNLSKLRELDLSSNPVTQSFSTIMPPNTAIPISKSTSVESTLQLLGNCLVAQALSISRAASELHSKDEQQILSTLMTRPSPNLIDNLKMRADFSHKGPTSTEEKLRLIALLTRTAVGGLQAAGAAAGELFRVNVAWKGPEVQDSLRMLAKAKLEDVALTSLAIQLDVGDRMAVVTAFKATLTSLDFQDSKLPLDQEEAEEKEEIEANGTEEKVTSGAMKEAVDRFAKPRFVMLASCQHLMSLNLSGNNLSSLSLNHFAELAKIQTLTTLNLSSCALTHRCPPIFLHALALTSLNLLNNPELWSKELFEITTIAPITPVFKNQRDRYDQAPVHKPLAVIPSSTSPDETLSLLEQVMISSWLQAPELKDSDAAFCCATSAQTEISLLRAHNKLAKFVEKMKKVATISSALYRRVAWIFARVGSDALPECNLAACSLLSERSWSSIDVEPILKELAFHPARNLSQIIMTLDAKGLPILLKHGQSLKNVDVSDSKLDFGQPLSGDENKVALSVLLDGLPNLETFKISGCDLSNCLEALAQASFEHLHTMSLSNCQLQGSLAFLRKCAALKHLDLSANPNLNLEVILYSKAQPRLLMSNSQPSVHQLLGNCILAQALSVPRSARDLHSQDEQDILQELMMLPSPNLIDYIKKRASDTPTGSASREEKLRLVALLTRTAVGGVKAAAKAAGELLGNPAIVWEGFEVQECLQKLTEAKLVEAVDLKSLSIHLNNPSRLDLVTAFGLTLESLSLQVSKLPLDEEENADDGTPECRFINLTKSCRKLTHLNLSDNDLGKLSLSQFAELAKISTLKTLNLSSCELHYQAAPIFLAQIGGLESINVQNNEALLLNSVKDYSSMASHATLSRLETMKLLGSVMIARDINTPLLDPLPTPPALSDAEQALITNLDGFADTVARIASKAQGLDVKLRLVYLLSRMEPHVSAAAPAGRSLIEGSAWGGVETRMILVAAPISWRLTTLQVQPDSEESVRAILRHHDSLTSLDVSGATFDLSGAGSWQQLDNQSWLFILANALKNLRSLSLSGLDLSSCKDSLRALRELNLVILRLRSCKLSFSMAFLAFLEQLEVLDLSDNESLHLSRACALTEVSYDRPSTQELIERAYIAWVLNKPIALSEQQNPDVRHLFTKFGSQTVHRLFEVAQQPTIRSADKITLISELIRTISDPVVDGPNEDGLDEKHDPATVQRLQPNGPAVPVHPAAQYAKVLIESHVVPWNAAEILSVLNHLPPFLLTRLRLVNGGESSSEDAKLENGKQQLPDDDVFAALQRHTRLEVLSLANSHFEHPNRVLLSLLVLKELVSLDLRGLGLSQRQQSSDENMIREEFDPRTLMTLACENLHHVDLRNNDKLVDYESPTSDEHFDPWFVMESFVIADLLQPQQQQEQEADSDGASASQISAQNRTIINYLCGEKCGRSQKFVDHLVNLAENHENSLLALALAFARCQMYSQAANLVQNETKKHKPWQLDDPRFRQLLALKDIKLQQLRATTADPAFLLDLASQQASLEVLDLSGSNLQMADFQTLTSLSRVSRLSLKGCQLTTVPWDLAPLVHAEPYVLEPHNEDEALAVTLRRTKSFNLASPILRSFSNLVSDEKAFEPDPAPLGIQLEPSPLAVTFESASRFSPEAGLSVSVSSLQNAEKRLIELDLSENEGILGSDDASQAKLLATNHALNIFQCFLISQLATCMRVKEHLEKCIFDWDRVFFPSKVADCASSTHNAKAKSYLVNALVRNGHVTMACRIIEEHCQPEGKKADKKEENREENWTSDHGELLDALAGIARSGSTNLRRLRIVLRGAEEIPPAILAQRNLEALDISDSTFSSKATVPFNLRDKYRNVNISGADAVVVSLGSLEHLTHLKMESCGLTVSPEWAGFLKHLKSFCVNGNPFCDAMNSIKGDPKLSLEFVKMLAEGTDKRRVVKVFVLGHGETGKTTWIDAVFRDATDYKAVDEYQRSTAVKFKSWSNDTGDVRLKTGAVQFKTGDVQFKILDFPGQPQYYVNNRKFLSDLNRSVVVLLLRMWPVDVDPALRKRPMARERFTNAQIEENKKQIDRWLKDLEKLCEGEKCSVVFTLSWADVADPVASKTFVEFLNDPSTQKLYPGIVFDGVELVCLKPKRKLFSWWPTSKFHRQWREIENLRARILQAGHLLVENNAPVPRVVKDIIEKSISRWREGSKIRKEEDLKQLIRDADTAWQSKYKDAEHEARVQVIIKSLEYEAQIVRVNATSKEQLYVLDPEWFAEFMSVALMPYNDKFKKAGDPIPPIDPDAPHVVSRDNVMDAIFAQADKLKDGKVAPTRTGFGHTRAAVRDRHRTTAEVDEAISILQVLMSLDIIFPKDGPLRTCHDFYLPMRLAKEDNVIEEEKDKDDVTRSLDINKDMFFPFAPRAAVIRYRFHSKDLKHSNVLCRFLCFLSEVQSSSSSTDEKEVDEKESKEFTLESAGRFVIKTDLTRAGLNVLVSLNGVERVRAAFDQTEMPDGNLILNIASRGSDTSDSMAETREALRLILVCLSAGLSDTQRWNGAINCSVVMSCLGGEWVSTKLEPELRRKKSRSMEERKNLVVERCMCGHPAFAFGKKFIVEALDHAYRMTAECHRLKDYIDTMHRFQPRKSTAASLHLPNKHSGLKLQIPISEDSKKLAEELARLREELKHTQQHMFKQQESYEKMLGVKRREIAAKEDEELKQSPAQHEFFLTFYNIVLGIHITLQGSLGGGDANVWAATCAIGKTAKLVSKGSTLLSAIPVAGSLVSFAIKAAHDMKAEQVKAKLVQALIDFPPFGEERDFFAALSRRLALCLKDELQDVSKCTSIQVWEAAQKTAADLDCRYVNTKVKACAERYVRKLLDSLQSGAIVSPQRFESVDSVLVALGIPKKKINKLKSLKSESKERESQLFASSTVMSSDDDTDIKSDLEMGDLDDTKEEEFAMDELENEPETSPMAWGGEQTAQWLYGIVIDAGASTEKAEAIVRELRCNFAHLAATDLESLRQEVGAIYARIIFNACKAVASPSSEDTH